jgi:rubrerythrin
MLAYQPIAGISGGKFVNRILEKLKVVREKNDERYKTELGTVMKAIHEENVKEYMEQLSIGQKAENKWKIEHGLPIRHKCSKCNCSFDVGTAIQAPKDAHCPICGNIDPLNL